MKVSEAARIIGDDRTKLVSPRKCRDVFRTFDRRHLPFFARENCSMAANFDVTGVCNEVKKLHAYVHTRNTRLLINGRFVK